jgi:calcineurin-like phosphoesterase family protein
MTTFFISDMHFGETALTQANQKDGGKIRRPFADAKEMDQTIIQRWNETVADEDVVWVLGDMVVSGMNKLSLLKGDKKLVAGNIDDLGAVLKSGLFSEITMAAWPTGTGMMLTHIPVHPTQLGKKHNVHGHTHEDSVPDPRYFCVSVDQIDYRPISLEQVKQKLAARIP